MKFWDIRNLLGHMVDNVHPLICFSRLFWGGKKHIRGAVKASVISSKSRFLHACRVCSLHSPVSSFLYKFLSEDRKSLRGFPRLLFCVALRRARHSSFGVYRPKNFLSSELKSSMKWYRRSPWWVWWIACYFIRACQFCLFWRANYS